MPLDTAQRYFSGNVTSRTDQSRSGRQVRQQLKIECLESRDLMAFTPISVTSLGGAGQDSGSRITLDSAGNQYLYGDYSATVDFDPANSYADNRDILTSNGDIDMFIAKYAPDGSLVWARGFGGASTDQTIDGTEGLAVDSAGNVYATSIFYGTVNYDGHVLTQPVGGSGAGNMLLRLNSQGVVDWASLVESDHFYFAVHNSLSGPVVYATGSATAYTEIAGISFTPTNRTGFLARINGTTGQADWLNRTTGSGSSFYGIAIDSPTSSVYLSGNASGEVIMGNITVSPGPQPKSPGKSLPGYAAVAKTDLDGNFLWARLLTTPSATTKKNSPTHSSGAGDITVHQGSLYVTGVTTGSATIDGQPLNSAGGRDAFFARLTADGNAVWAQRIGSSADDYSNRLVADPAGNLFAGLELRGSAPIGSVVQSAGQYLVQFNNGNGQVVNNWRLGDPYNPNSSTGQAFLEGLAVDTHGDLWATGSFINTTTFPDGTTLTPNGSSDVYVLRLTDVTTLAAAPVTGTFSQTRVAGSNAETAPASRSVDLNAAALDAVMSDFSNDSGEMLGRPGRYLRASRRQSAPAHR